MLRVTVEVVPEGNEQKRRTIGSFEISNVSHLRTDDDDPDYVAAMYGQYGNEENRCSVARHDRGRGWQVLLAQVLAAFGYKP